MNVATLALLACIEPDPSNPTDETGTPTPPETGTSTPVPPDSENVLLVVLDDVGVEHLGLYTDSEDVFPTPTLDGLAAEGMVFRNAWATPLCSSTARRC